MGKVEVNKEMKRNALYKTAFELFTTQGITKTTVSDIVNKAGVAKGTFYLYFNLSWLECHFSIRVVNRAPRHPRITVSAG